MTTRIPRSAKRTAVTAPIPEAVREITRQLFRDSLTSVIRGGVALLEVVGDRVEGGPADAVVGVDVLDQPLEHSSTCGRPDTSGWMVMVKTA